MAEPHTLVTDRVTSAPGKLIIAGEYAVLEGHPALVAAVERRAYCALSPGDELTVSAFGKGPLPVALENRKVVVRGGDESFALLEAALQVAVDRGLGLPRGHLSVDTTAFYRGNTKLGLGSSAAVAVALTAQLGSTPFSGLDDVSPMRVCWMAMDAHERFSAPARGSGLDVAASSYGGVHRFTRNADKSVQMVPWNLCPGGLRMLVPFAGVAANTRLYLDGVRHLRAQDAAGYKRALDDISFATLELLGAVSPSEDPRVFLSAVDRCRRSLQRLGDRAALDIVSPAHLEIARIARLHAGAAKPSGAGGGDVAVCFVPEDTADACARAFEDAGFPLIDVDTAPAGVRREHAPV